MLDHNCAEAMCDELVKVALAPARIGNIVGGLVGGAGGALTGYATAPEGEQPQAMISRGLQGALLGAAGGQLATRAGRGEALRFGQKQLHGFTGYLPGRGIFGNKGAPLSTADRLESLKSIGFNVPEGSRAELLDKARSAMSQGKVTRHLPESVRNAWAGAQARQQFHQQQLLQRGATSLPGMAKAMVSGGVPGALQTLKSNVLSQGVIGGAVLPAAFMAPTIRDAARGDTSNLGADIGSTIGYGLAGATPLGATMALGGLGSAIGEAID